MKLCEMDLFFSGEGMEVSVGLACFDAHRELDDFEREENDG